MSANWNKGHENIKKNPFFTVKVLKDISQFPSLDVLKTWLQMAPAVADGPLGEGWMRRFPDVFPNFSDHVILCNYGRSVKITQMALPDLANGHLSFCFLFCIIPEALKRKDYIFIILYHGDLICAANTFTEEIS